MAATVTIHEINGNGTLTEGVVAPGGSATESAALSNVRHCSADVANDDGTNKIAIPAAGSNYGYVKTLRAKASGTFTSLSNWAWYTDGANGYGTDITLKARAIGQASYAQATGTAGSTGDQNASITANAFGYVSGTPLSLTGSISSAGVGTVQLVQLQMVIGSTAVTGATGSELYTWKWDEV